MNIGKDKRHAKYVCDKCKKVLYKEINQYCKKRYKDSTYKKDFDLCENCERKFREWLNFKEMQEVKEIINSFPRYKIQEK